VKGLLVDRYRKSPTAVMPTMTAVPMAAVGVPVTAPMNFGGRANSGMIRSCGCTGCGKRHRIRLLRRGHNKHQTRNCEKSEQFLHRQALL